MKIGTYYLDNGKCKFVVWAPLLTKVDLELLGDGEQIVEMKKDEEGYWTVELENIDEGQEYLFRLNEGESFPDPASRFQAKGVHGASQVIDIKPADLGDWQGRNLKESIIYELHVGTFSKEGTFDGVINKIKYLKDLGINTIELMPLAQCPGEKNWGYDGVYPFAVQSNYGGPKKLQELIKKCHENDIAVIIDVVYNHFGPEGNYFWQYGPYFNHNYNTPWGDAINYDAEYSYGVRNYFLENVKYWLQDMKADGLRLDAIHAIYDKSAINILSEIATIKNKIEKDEKREIMIIAESDLNDVKVISGKSKFGTGLDAQWCDDFHHALHTFLTGENKGYYEDYGTFEDIEKTYKEGFVYSNKFSKHRKKYVGNNSKGVKVEKLVVCIQNHDQTGNRLLGERISNLVDFEKQKLAAAAVLLSPYTPMLFMGEEYGEKNPFMFFSDYGDEKLIEGVKKGRQEEFKYFGWKEDFIDPQADETYEKSKLSWDIDQNKELHKLYKKLIEVRKEEQFDKRSRKNMKIKIYEDEKVICIKYDNHKKSIFTVLNFSNNDATLKNIVPEGKWEKIIDSAEKVWGGESTVLPKVLSGKVRVTVRKNSFIVYKHIKKNLFGRKL